MRISERIREMKKAKKTSQIIIKLPKSDKTEAIKNLSSAILKLSHALMSDAQFTIKDCTFHATSIHSGLEITSESELETKIINL